MAISIEPGTAIPSPNVQPNRQYVDGRNIGNLVQVGAVTADEAELLNRVDNVIENRPPDGRPAIDEMVKLEQPDFRATLFPNEQTIQPGLWRQLEWENAPAIAAPTLPTLESQILDQSVAPGAVNRTLPVTITDLPADLQKTARRVELVLNSDADASTISLADLDQAIAQPRRFLPTEVEDFHRISEELLKRQPSQPRAVLAVPMPGSSQVDFTAASLTFAIKQQTAISEYRTIEDPGNQYGAQLDARRNSSLQITVPPGDKAILINIDSGAETLLDEGTRNLEGHSGNYRAERWRNGTRVEVADVKLPALENESVQLFKYVDHELQANGVTLPKRLTNAGTGYTGGRQSYSAQYTFDPAATFPAPDQTKIDIAKVTDSPKINLPAGRYVVDVPQLGRVTLDLYPQGVVKAQYNNVEYKLQLQKLPGGSYGNYPKGFQTPSDPFVYFDPNTNQAGLSTRGVFQQVTVTPEHRVG